MELAPLLGGAMLKGWLLDTLGTALPEHAGQAHGAAVNVMTVGCGTTGQGARCDWVCVVQSG